MINPVINISLEVGEFLKNERQKISAADIEFKGRTNDLVSRADKEAEAMFVEFLSQLLPEAGFIAEEGTSTKVGDEYNWIIDPLDGTTNYLYGVPMYCTSVALKKNNELVLGVIYDPEHNACFSAELGSGAFLNADKIQVSKQNELAKSLLATGFPYNDNGRADDYLQLLGKVNAATRGIRRLGSAALDMAYVACGRFDAFYEYGLNPWDIAAGGIIIREAGGKVSTFNGNDDFVFEKTLLCSNSILHDSLVEQMRSF